MYWDFEFLLCTNIKDAIVNMCDDLLHLCMSMGLSTNEEIIMLSLSRDHNESYIIERLE